MSAKRKFPETGTDVPKKSTKSWKAVTTAIKFFEDGRYGKALPRLFKYEDCEVRAMLLLAFMYFNGIGVIENLEKSVFYLEKIAKCQGIREGEEGLLAEAMYRLGELYYRGIVVAKDDVHAEKCWLRGATLHKDPATDCHLFASVQCQKALGMFYSNPEKDDVKKAFYWHKKASESGCIISEGALGVMYMYGIGTSENFEIAFKYLQNAAVQGNTYAKGYLTALYYKRQMYERTVSLGREMAFEEDFAELAKLQDCAIDHVKRGVSMGCFYLALCCQYGYSIPKDIDFSKTLIKKALELCPDLAIDVHETAILGTA